MPDEQVIHILPLHQSRRLDNIPGILDNFMAIGRQLVDMDLKSGFDRFEHLVGPLVIGHTTLAEGFNHAIEIDPASGQYRY
jgi:hypothetical protein